jgi:uncharacterized membrane protein YeiH
MMITDILEFLGTFAFAVSGIRMASNKEFDWFGAYVVGVATAIGGGTLRDIQLGITPFWMTSPFYLLCSLLALACVIYLRTQLNRWSRTMLIFDTIGLALFTVVGIDKTLALGFPMWVAIVMGCLTGVAGGVLRDILIREVPLIFREELYATPTLVGGGVYWLTAWIITNYELRITSYGIPAIVAGASILVLRLLSVHYGWSLPRMRKDIN